MTDSLLPSASIPGADASPLFDSSACQISLLLHHITYKPFSSKKNDRTDKQVTLCPRQSIPLSIYEAPTFPLSIDHTLLLIPPVLNALTLAYVDYPSRYDTVSQHESEQGLS